MITCKQIFYFKAAVKRSIDTSASYALLTDDRLPTDIIPQSYEIHLEPNYEKGTFSGHVKINLVWKSDTNKIALHAHFDLNINDKKIVLRKLNKNNRLATLINPTIFELYILINYVFSDLQLPKHITVQRGSRFPKKTIYIVYLTEIIKQGSECVLEIPFEGYIWESAEGLFKGSYSNLTYLATSLRPNNARRLFPCFDEPRFKVSLLPTHNFSMILYLLFVLIGTIHSLHNKIQTFNYYF